MYSALREATIVPLTAILAAAAKDVPEPVQRNFFDIMKEAASLVTAVTVVAGAVWWLLAPRVKRYIEGLVHPIQKQVTPNGTSTAEERLVTTADRLVKLERVSTANTRRIIELAEHDQKHDEQGRAYVQQVIGALKAQGITVPDPPKE